ncbi:MAG: hypothetical protein HY290_15940 [Planctomycetia bacterium]|nr:hypothetical protein [Planctomycetia bacterium]
MKPLRWRRSSIQLLALALCIVTGAAPAVCAARDHYDGFDGARPSWTIVHDRTAARVTRHARSVEVRREGQAAELFDVGVKVDATLLQLVCQLPKARLIDDMKLSLWFQSTQDGATLAARVVFPNQIDPESGTTLIVPVEGDSYSKVGQWQKLECTDIDRKVRKMLPLIRKRFQNAGVPGDIDVSGRYVDTAIINIRSSRGASRFVVDALRFGPIVEAEPDGPVQPVERTEPEVEPVATFRSSFLNVHGQPFFPRIIPYHGEQPADLAKQGLNVVWIPNYEDTRLLADLNRAGLWAMAVPPEPRGEDGNPRFDPSSVHLAPFGPDTAQILFWYLGTKIQPDEKAKMMAWLEQIRSADRTYKRQIMGDVAGLERSYSRQFSMLGVQRPAVHTSLSPRNYRNWLTEHRNLAHPGSFLWTWIQTEASPSVNEIRESAGWRPLVVEPEQLRLQVYAALSAGYRGIGFWTCTSLDDERPGARERKLMMALLNMELDLLEPLIATGSVGSPAKFTAQGPAARNLKGLATPGRMSRADRAWEQELNDRDNQLLSQEEIARDLEASVLKTDLGRLVLPVWYADEAQYVPGRMAGNNAKIIAEGVGESARAWEITTTDVHELASERVTGGKQVSLDRFEMTTAILFTTNQTAVERFREKVRTLAEPASRVTLELARAKFERVSAVDADLTRLGRGQKDAINILPMARNRIDQAEKLLQSQRYHDARIAAGEALQLLRVLQYAHWTFAAHRFYTPVASPHTLCFQTLPDHWEMIARIGRTAGMPVKNLLRSGDCEDKDTMVAEGWKRTETEIPDVQSTGELHAGAHQGTYCLRLAAAPAPGKPVPVSVADRPVTITTPPVTVYKGQLVYISGWVKLTVPAVGNLDGAVFYDSLLGPSAALHWRAVTDWKKFEVIREVHETTDLTLTMALSGLGDVRFDDLQIIPLDVESGGSRGGGPNGTPVSRPGKGAPWDFLRRIPGFGGKSDSN